jgi:ribosomal protein S18 acetylase RimI-like enzyme
MDQDRYRFRPFTPSDYEGESRIDTRVNPSMPVSVEEVRHWNEVLAAPRLALRKIVVEERASRTMVGVGVIHRDPDSYDLRKFWTWVGVDPDHQKRGIGRELFETLERGAVNQQAICLWASVRKADSRSVRFFNTLGFVERRQRWLSRLDLAAVDLSGFPDRSAELAAQGIHFTTLSAEGAERPEVLERLYHLHASAAQDEPRLDTYTPVLKDEFLKLELGWPGALPDALFLARAGNQYVAMSSHYRTPGEPDTLRVGFTGTLREYRGRGIASELKRRAVEYARNRGYRCMRTSNDSLNQPIWAINERLGFRRELEWIQGEKQLLA